MEAGSLAVAGIGRPDPWARHGPLSGIGSPLMGRPGASRTLPSMTPMKLTAGGVTALLAISGAVTIGHSLLTHPLSSPWSSSSGSTRPVADDLTARNVYNGAKNSVAYIGASTAEGQATGSGFVVSDDGYIVTNAHVVEGAGDRSTSRSATASSAAAQLVGHDASTDLALLKVDAAREPHAAGARRLRHRRRSATRLRDRQPVRPRPHAHDRRRLRAPARDQAPNGCRSTTASRPTRRSTPATPAARCSTPPAR